MIRTLIVTLILPIFIVTTNEMKIDQDLVGDADDKERLFNMATEYLSRFGYMKKEPRDGKSSSLTRVDSAIEKFKAFAGLKQTGKLNQETVELMKMKRCGVKDVLEDDEDNSRGNLMNIKTRSKRYALQGSRWKNKNLKYKISKYPTRRGLSKKDVDETMRRAFNVWEKETDLKFVKRRTGKVHIDIRFETKFHGDDDPFDGEGGTLAHAFFPVFGGDAHFDDDEDWTVNTFRGTSLLMTASHELGHSLGLSHSNVRRSLMAPFYRGYEKDVSLYIDDIQGIQSLYGEKSAPFIVNTEPEDDKINVRSNVKPFETESNELCRNDQIDTMVTMKNGDTYVFRGDTYWKLTETSVAPGYPRQISDGWSGLPGNLDAAFTWRNGKTYIFKGSKYWRFSSSRSMDIGYPKDLAHGFKGIPANVDASFVWPVNNKIYFFKGSNYWKFDPDRSPPVDATYPRPISNWEGIPNHLQAVMQYSNGKSYFFKSGRYYRFDDQKFHLDNSANPPYPRDTGFWWFGCDVNSNRLRETKE